MLPVSGGKWFTEMSVGDHLLNYDSMRTLTHFKGHVMGGFGGSNKNIGIGCADGRIGKAMIHAKNGNDWGVNEEELMEKITESTRATVDHFGAHNGFINVLRNMSVSCDCEGVEAEPVVTPNIASWRQETYWRWTRRAWISCMLLSPTTGRRCPSASPPGTDTGSSAT